MLLIFGVTLALVLLAFLGLGFNIFLRRVAFPETEVGHNKKMKELGIYCSKCEEWKSFKEKRKFKDVKLDIGKLSL